MKFNFIEGGVCAPAGFLASGVLAGIKKNSVKKDLALVFSERDCCAAGMFTKNVVKAEPVLITRDRVSPDNPCSRQIRGIVANSGNANACTGEEGRRNALRMTDSVEKELKVPAGSVLVCSTGVIGQQLNIEAVEKAVPSLAAGLGKNGNADARVAIMTTDTVYKECAVEFEIKGRNDINVINEYESKLSKNVEELSKNEKFFNLPLNHIFSIISKVDFNIIEESDKTIEIIQNIIKNIIKMHYKEKETILILQNINTTEFSHDEIFSLLELLIFSEIIYILILSSSSAFESKEAIAVPI